MRTFHLLKTPDILCANESEADDTGLAPKESVIEALCGFPDGLPAEGFVFLRRFFW